MVAFTTMLHFVAVMACFLLAPTVWRTQSDAQLAITLRQIGEALLYPLTLLPDEQIADSAVPLFLFLNSLIWGLAIASGARWVINRVRARRAVA